MKYFLIALLLCASITFAQDVPARVHGNAGEVYVVSLFEGLSHIGISNFNGGFGLRYFVLPGASIRGTVGGTITTGGEVTNREINTSIALLVDLAGGHKGNLYVGPTVIYSHAGAVQDNYTWGGVVGAELCNFISDQLTFGVEYPLTVTSSPSDGSHTWTFGKTSGELILNLKL